MRGLAEKAKKLMTMDPDSRTANDERLYELLDRAAIREKALIALQIAVAHGHIEVAAKYRELDPAVFWAYIAATRPRYTYEACVEFGRRACGDRAGRWRYFTGK